MINIKTIQIGVFLSLISIPGPIVIFVAFRYNKNQTDFITLLIIGFIYLIMTLFYWYCLLKALIEEIEVKQEPANENMVVV
jgi:hypothetical protein